MQEEIKKDLKEIAKESEEKGFAKFMEWYHKIDDSINKTLMEMLDEKKEQQYGLRDLWKQIKEKFGSSKDEKDNN
jgi:hypothetical protein